MDKKLVLVFCAYYGAIHNGHLKLIETSKKQCRQTICSIFINPTQFNNKEDYKSYPKKLDEDYIKLQQAKCDLIYAPEVSDLYKKNETAKKFNFKTLDLLMEGKFRDNHFNGVATVIEKLFKLLNLPKLILEKKIFNNCK